jgi:hypothetical protein
LIIIIIVVVVVIIKDKRRNAHLGKQYSSVWFSSVKELVVVDVVQCEWIGCERVFDEV